MPERQVFFWVSFIIKQDIELRDDVIIVRDTSWLEHSYRWTAKWARETLGINLWPHRG
jgi:hypothetical protein